MLSARTIPSTDPTPIFEHFRGSYATELLTAAVCHFHVFGRLARQSRTMAELAGDLNLANRPTVVLTTALTAMGLLVERDGRLDLTDLAREHLLPEAPFDVGGYVGLAAQSPGVLAMVEALKSNRPMHAPTGTAFIFREGVASAMDESESARHFTLALAGRAKNVAPHLARTVDLSTTQTLVDIGGGSGIYAIAFLQHYPQLRAKVFDRPEVLKVAAEMASAYGVADRLECVPGDMFHDPVPAGDVALLSNILHDWDVAECQALVARAGAPMLLVHDVFLDGSLARALYSAALFTLTEGRLYRAEEVADWMHAAGYQSSAVRPTLVHCGVLVGTRHKNRL